MEKIDAATPFKSDLGESRISKSHVGGGKLMELKSGPDKIVRVETFSDLVARFKGKVDPVRAAQIGSRLYKELEVNYGIPVPVEFFIGQNPRGENSVFGIVDKIDGKDLNAIEAGPEIMLRTAETYAKVARYYLDHLQKDGPYLADINGPTGYVYGKRKGSDTNEIYLVDTDLYFRSEKAALYNTVLWLVRHMLSMERRFGSRFLQARAIIQQFLDAPLPEGLHEKTKGIISDIADRTRKYLRGEKISAATDAHPIFSEFEE